MGEKQSEFKSVSGARGVYREGVHTEGRATRTQVLIERWRSGNADAMERVAAGHFSLLVKRARLHPLRPLLRTRPDPEDLAQDALARALASNFFERFEDRGKGSLRNALYRFLDHTIQDALRRERALKRSPNGVGLDCDKGLGGLTSESAEMEDHREPSPTSEARTQEWIEACKSLLPDREWAVWNAIEIEGESTGQLAQELGVSESSIRGLLHRARLRILSKLVEKKE